MLWGLQREPCRDILRCSYYLEMKGISNENIPAVLINTLGILRLG
jgi:hypothetical protein